MIWAPLQLNKTVICHLCSSTCPFITAHRVLNCLIFFLKIMHESKFQQNCNVDNEINLQNLTWIRIHGLTSKGRGLIYVQINIPTY